MSYAQIYRSVVAEIREREERDRAALAYDLVGPLASHAFDYGTDNGPPCVCGGTVYRYKVDAESRMVGTRCEACRTCDAFRVRRVPTSATETRHAHMRRAADPTYRGLV